jgi:hypothetical protein
MFSSLPLVQTGDPPNLPQSSYITTLKSRTLSVCSLQDQIRLVVAQFESTGQRLTICRQSDDRPTAGSARDRRRFGYVKCSPKEILRVWHVKSTSRGSCKLSFGTCTSSRVRSTLQLPRGAESRTHGAAIQSALADWVDGDGWPVMWNRTKPACRS